MEELEYYEGVRELLNVIAKNVGKGLFNIDFALLNDVGIETNKRLAGAKENEDG